MPARLVHQDERMRARRDRLRDLGEVQAHALRGAAGQGKPCSFALSPAACSKDVGPGGPLVFRGCGAGAAFGPAPGDLVLLPDPGLIGEPDLERLAADRLPDPLQAGREVFLKASTAVSLLA